MISRFYCPLPLQAGHSITLPPEAAHHALHVLRLRKGDELVVFDGQGGEYPGKVTEIAPMLRLAVSDWHAVDRESPLQMTLAQALPSADKMDWVVQKAVELGVAAIQPVQSKRSVIRLIGERVEKRRVHWQHIAIAACEQSGRNCLPEIATVLDLPHYLAQPPGENETRLMLSPLATACLSTLPRPEGKVTLLIGPEGGFTEDEEAAALAVGFRAVKLGPRILRTETAGLAAMAAMLALWGDF